MERSGGPRRWANRATFVLTGVVVAIAFVAIRVLTILARVGRHPPDGPTRRLLMLPHDPVDQSGTRHRILAWADRLRALGVVVRVCPPNRPGELSALYGRAPQRMEFLALLTLVRRTLQVLVASRQRPRATPEASGMVEAAESRPRANCRTSSSSR